MLAHRVAPNNKVPVLKALFSLSVNTAADWRSLYLNDNDSVNINALRSKGEQLRCAACSSSFVLVRDA